MCSSVSAQPGIWTGPLAPDKRYVLKYRMLVYDGTISPQQAEMVWKGFANPPQVVVTK